jgi:DNA topoisomerase-1
VTDAARPAPKLPLVPVPPVRLAKRAGLVYVTDTQPGILRVRAGRGFTYRTGNDRPVSDPRILDRIRLLAIPPAYTDVWICRLPRGHLQATGRDARGRKQYRYHVDWTAIRDVGKFDRIVAFGEALPRLRRRLNGDLNLEGFPREKVTAIVIAVLADTMIRIGNDEYARSNRSFGLTTLRNRHVEFLQGGRARFRFQGKGGLVHDIVLDDERLVRLMRRCQQLPGQTLFQYRDDAGRTQPLGSSAVNAYLRAVMNDAFTSKDFRTFAGTLSAFRMLARTPLPVGRNGRPPSERALAQVENQVVRIVADVLGNTPAVSRKAYIDPVVFAGWRDGTLARAAQGCVGSRQWEVALVRFLRRAHAKGRGASAAARPSGREGAAPAGTAGGARRTTGAARSGAARTVAGATRAVSLRSRSARTDPSGHVGSRSGRSGDRSRGREPPPADSATPRNPRARSPRSRTP